MPPATVLAWISNWDILDVDTNKRYNTAVLVRWKRLFRFLYTAVVMARDPSVGLIFHNGRRLGESLASRDREPRAPRRLLPLGNMVKIELQDEMEDNDLEYQGLSCREMRVILNDRRIQNGQIKKKSPALDPDLKGVAKMKRAELLVLAKKKGIKVSDDMLKDKIICLLQGQVPRAIKKEELKEEALKQLSTSRSAFSSRSGACAAKPSTVKEPTSSAGSENDADQISEEDFVTAENIGREESPEGPRLKRKMKPGQTKRFKDMISKALMFLTWQTAFLGSFFIKPLFNEGKAIAQDMRDIFSIKTNLRYDLMQIFAGEAVLSEEFSQAGLKVCEPIDQRCNYDLRTPADRREVLNMYHACRPRLVTLEFPCTLWTQLTRKNYKGEYRQQELRRKRLRDKPLLEFVEEVSMLQLGNKNDILVENPWESEAFKQPQLLRMMAHPRVHEVKVDMCRFNLRHPRYGGKVRKSTKLLVSNESYVRKLGKICDEKHRHDHLEGAHYTRLAGRYTKEFAKAVLVAYQCNNSTYMMEYGVYATGDLMDLMGGESDEWFYYENVRDYRELPTKLPDGPDWTRVGRRRITDLDADVVLQDFEKADIPLDHIRAKLDRTAKLKLHQNLGHPSNEDLARSLRFSGCRAEVVKAAKSLRCASCMSKAKKKIARPARLSHTADFNEQIGLDCFSRSSVAVDLERGFGSVFQEMLDRFHCTVVPVAGAKNALRRQCGFSPEQWVFGKSARLPADLVDGAHHDAAHEGAELQPMERQLKMRTAARKAFMEMQNDSTMRKALLGRARVTPHPLEQGDLCFYYRQLKKGSIKKGTWLGPAVVVGKQGQNYWISHGGFTKLIAPEHARPISSEEIWWPGIDDQHGEAIEQLQRAIRDTDVAADMEYEDLRAEPPPPPEEEDAADVEIGPPEADPSAEVAQPQDEADVELPSVEAEAARQAAQPYYTIADDDLDEGSSTNAAFATMLRGAQAQSERLRKKLQDKEIAWKDIPDEQKGLYIKAIVEHWEEWKKFGSVEVMSPEASAKAREQNDKSRFLPSRFVFRDKNATIRTEANPVPVKAKARLCAGGLPGLMPGQVLRAVKGVFGLATAPRQWWATLKSTLLKVELIGENGRKFNLVQSLVDPALFVGHGSDGSLQAIVCVHVDDLLIAASTKSSYQTIKELVPFGGWQGLPFTFCAKDVTTRADGSVILCQEVFADKLEPLDLTKERKRDLGCPATELEIAENRSLVGSLGWLGTQTRPDLSAGVSMSQRVQNSPVVADLIETNRIVSEARRFKETGVTIPKMEGDLCILVFHDAAWANVDEPDDKVSGVA
ncbi:unnamed protein product [Prorocentrum cordatum]|uniref:Uncharacterized protein n=1 Tax=Prorocentrum cordatum TaxID=2364126 RepID=A0ABN9RM61_9DINO|nr:unnamed protein product [Polarella glacialis]